MNRLYGGIEAGGTKFVCAIGTGPGDLRSVVRFPTTTPAESLSRAIEFFRTGSEGGNLAAIGIGSFGPVDPNPASATFGYITTTPKPGWAHTDFARTIERALGIPVGFDTDVNAAGLGEHRWGAAQGLHTFIYLTIGTGIGGGAMIDGQMVHGLIHPEMGHIRIPHDWATDPYAGACPYHGDGWEGLAAGPAIESRWRLKPESLPADHPAWDLEAHYTALALSNLICTFSPQRIVIGGGVLEQPALLPRVRAQVLKLLNDYVSAPAILHAIDHYIVSPGLGRQAGVLGALALAQLQVQPLRPG
ncbi:MAG: ROK family protein [Chloroflexi bacterium]|nr:ROK family protein [Chloroflexota bacterium]